jgi:putative membrane protein
VSLHLDEDQGPRLRKPLVVDYDDSEALDPGAAAPVPDAPSAATMAAVKALGRPSSGFSRFAFWVFSSLFTFVLSVAAWNFVTGLFASNSLLGWIAFVLLIAALLLVLVMAAKELSAYARMARLDRLRAGAVEARAKANLKAARASVAAIAGIYASREDQAWGIARLRERQDDVFDADALLSLAERELMGPLDRAAMAEVEAAARQVATVTAFVPMALADVATALYSNLRLIRKLALIYGGRSGSFGSWRLLRRVFSALLGAGAIALADDLIGSVTSGGILSKLSRRFGEGVVNGALTARVGLAAMELSRPMPFVALPRPNTSATTSRALAGLFGRAEAEAAKD